MQDFNLPGSLGNRNAQASISAGTNVANPKSISSSLVQTLLPVSVTQAGQAVKVNDANGKLIAAGKLPPLTNTAASAVLTNNAQSLLLFSQRKTLFDALISAEQQGVILDLTAKQPNLAKLSATDLTQLTTRNAIVQSLSAQQITLKLAPPLDGLEQVTLKNIQNTSSLQLGQQVKIQLHQIGDKWIARIVSPSQTVSQQSESTTTTKQNAVLETQLTSRDPLLQSILKVNIESGINVTKSPKLLETVIALLPKQQSSVAKQVVQQMSSATNLQIDKQGRLALSAQLPVAKLTPEGSIDTASHSSGLKTLGKPAEIAVEQFLKLPQQQKQQLYDFLKSLPDYRNFASADKPTALKTELAATVRTSLQGPENKDSTPITRTPNTLSEGAKSAIPKAFIEQVTTLIRQHFVNSAPTTESANTLSTVITELTQSRDPALQNWGKQLQQALAPMISKKEPELAQLQTLLQMPALPVTTASLTKISPSNSMVGGLIALLQVSLSSRLPQRQSVSSERIAQLFSQLTQTATVTTQAATSTTPKQQNTRTLQEFSQLEQRHQLLRTLSKALSNHHYSKLSSAESALQGMDVLFYSLPSYSSSSQRDIELLIKREERNDKEAAKNGDQHSTWHLTMLLDIGDYGEALTKCKLNDEDLQLDIYTSSEALKERVLDFLPLLKKRLSGLGLNIVSSQCQLGKIPDSLRPKPYQLLNTQA